MFFVPCYNEPSDGLNNMTPEQANPISFSMLYYANNELKDTGRI